MLDKLIELMKVKSIITILVITVFAYLSTIGKIDVKDFMIVTMAIITYYFAKPDKN